MVKPKTAKKKVQDLDQKILEKLEEGKTPKQIALELKLFRTDLNLSRIYNATRRRRDLQKKDPRR